MGTPDPADETDETAEGATPSEATDARSGVGQLEAPPRRKDGSSPRIIAPVPAWRGVMPWRRVR